MYELKRLNVHRIVDSEEKRDRLISMGFELVEKAEASALECPHCGKKHKKQADLDKHIAKEHGEGTNPPAPPAGDGGGSGEGTNPPTGE